MVVKGLAGAINLVESFWTLYVTLTSVSPSPYCLVCGLPANFWAFDVFLALGVLLLIDAVVCFVGIWLAFPIGALLSFLMLPLVALEWNALGTMYSSISIGVAVAAIISDGFAAVSRTKLPEQNHPLN